MRTTKTLALLAAMAAAALAQDPNRNRMNDPMPEARPQETVGRPSPQILLPSPVENRMNVQYPESAAAELTGGPDPCGNRITVEWPKARPKAEPRESERAPVEPRLSP